VELVTKPTDTVAMPVHQTSTVLII